MTRSGHLRREGHFLVYMHLPEFFLFFVLLSMVMYKLVIVKPFLLFKINKGQNNSFWREPTVTFTDLF